MLNGSSRKITAAVLLAHWLIVSSLAHAQTVKSIVCDPISGMPGANKYNTTTTCKAVFDKAVTGSWYNAVNQECSKFCQSKGLVNTYSPDGFKCTSGEERPQSAIGVVDFKPTGCWHSCAQPEGLPGAVSVGALCYHPTQKRDNDRTDHTVGCFCDVQPGTNSQTEVSILASGVATITGVSATQSGWTSLSSIKINDQAGRIFFAQGSIPSGGAATLTMSVNVQGACGTAGVVSAKVGTGAATNANVILPGCPAVRTECSDGIDNDGDGKVDALVDVAAAVEKVQTFGGNGDPMQVASLVANAIATKKLAFKQPNAPLVRTDNGTWDTGTPHLPTLNQVCRILGYKTYVSSTCLDGERSARYPKGKCNYHSPGDNQLFRFNGTNFAVESANPKYGKTWIATITCSGELSACSDGVDNDGDGKVDLADDGCASASDTDERPHDPQCKTPASPSEFAQCNDLQDNDSDGLIDRADPGCWSDVKNQNTYDPNRDNEAAATSECQDTKDNDGDTLIDAKDPGCFTNPKDPATYDRTRNNETAAAPGECMDGKDNDSDTLIDAKDPGCWKNLSDPNSYSPYGGPESSATTQCQDTKDNDGDTLIDAKDPGCFTNPKDPATYDRTRNNEALVGPGECMDGKDNDSDTLIDAKDPGCWKNLSDPSSYNPYGGPESTATTQCQDTKDNDGDTLIDAKDPGCFTNPKDPATYDRTRNNEALVGPGECMDGKDNDSDTLIDAKDPGCWKNLSDPNSYNAYGGPESSATTQCQDGVDNDKDGLIDMKDPGCTAVTDNDETNKTTQCTDKVDNDNDNLIDLADPGCKDASDDNEGDEPALLTIGVECVVDNTDKTKTAYFSYNNTANADLTVTTDAQAGTLNEFVTSGSKTAVPTVFKAGSSKGTVVVTFSSEALTWVVRAPKSALSQASANAQTPRCGKVVPVAECRGYKGGLMQVRFGYTNPNAFQLSVPVGANNSFSPGVADRGQPVKFFAGKNSSVFDAPLASDAEVVTWSINGSSVTAPTTLPTCNGQCTDAATSTTTGNLDAIAAQLSGVMNRAAELLASAKANLSQSQIKRNRVDAERAKKKASEYEQAANAITVQYPAVVKTCPEAPPLCVTVDRGPSLDALKGLYANQRNSVQRTIARTYFRNSGKTSRDDKLVQQAKDLEQQGLAEIMKLPRIVVECK